MDYKDKITELLNSNELTAEQKEAIAEIFPECVMSEDERIRKALIEHFKWNVQQILNDFDNKEVLAWLEKQGEQKDIDKVEPKFREGDTIQPKDRGHEPWQIMQVDILDKKYRFKDGYVIPFSHEDDYELVEQKPAWSEEDEYTLGETIQHLEELIRIEKVKHCGIDVQYYQRDIDWLKSLKDRVQPKQEWSEEDEKMYNVVHDLAWESYKTSRQLDIPTFGIINDWLKSLRPQNRWKPSEEQMEALYDSIPENVMEISEREMLLNELYKDLKKLREE